MIPDDDPSDDFELRLRRGGRLVPELESEIDGPDPECDRLVLARARAAITEPRRGGAARHFTESARWALPLALAATLVLSFALVLQRDSRDATAPPAAERAAMPAEPPVPAAATLADDVAQATAAESVADVPAARVRGAAATAVRAEPSPPEWIARIERLQAAGDLAAARREIAALRAQYPDVALPEGLRALADR